MNPIFAIAGRPIGPGHPVFIIAEAGVAHFGKIEDAFRLVDMAVDAGADAVKFQIYRAERMISADSPEWRARMGSKELPPEAFTDISRYCRQRGILFFATPHEEDSADVLEGLDVPVFKIGSGEISNPPFLRHLARKKRPIILSTGMYTLDDVREAFETLASEGLQDLAILHCVTAYPADPRDVNLRAMDTLRATFGVPVGYSDHTAGYAIPLAAVARGADVIEKHIGLAKNVPGSQDSLVCCDPPDLTAMVAAMRAIQGALGDGVKRPTEAELRSREWARKSIVSRQALPAGTVLTADMVCFKRPGTGISPNHLDEVLGARVVVPVAADMLIRWDDLERRPGR